MAKKRKQTFEVGHQVHVGEGTTFFVITRILPDGFGCFIREDRLAPNGKPYAEQRSDLSLLRHAVTDELLNNLSCGAFKAVRGKRVI